MALLEITQWLGSITTKFSYSFIKKSVMAPILKLFSEEKDYYVKVILFKTWPVAEEAEIRSVGDSAEKERQKIIFSFVAIYVDIQSRKVNLLED